MVSRQNLCTRCSGNQISDFQGSTPNTIFNTSRKYENVYGSKGNVLVEQYEERNSQVRG